MRIYRFSWLWALVFLPVFAVAQRTQVHLDPDKLLKEGEELFQKEKYAAAQQKFREFLNSDGVLAHFSVAEASYYEASCAVELFNENAEYLVKKFIEKYPESPKIIQAWFMLGKVYFRNKAYDQAIEAFKNTDVFILTKEQYFEFYYKLAYSEFMEEKYSDALLHFAEVKDRENIYAVPATYYYAHISYEKQNYEVALQHFLKIENDKNFSKVVPYYIAQIYYFQGKYDQAVLYAEPIADTITGKNEGNILRILAESYFELKNYSKSVAYFTKLENKRYTLDRIGYYRGGQAYFQTGDYAMSNRYLQNVTTEKDSITQTAYYYIAEGNIKLDRKQMALEALKAAWSYDFIPRIKQEAMFNYAKLSYELGYNPYNEAVEALEMYLNTYPNAVNREEAYSLLVEIYMNTKNYKAALESLAKIKNKNTKLKIAEQRIYYFRGIELFNNLDYSNAILHFNEAINKNFDAKITAEATYWKAETFYRQHLYSQSEATFEAFLASPEARNTNLFYSGYYNLGYARFKQKNYTGALKDFRTYTDASKGNDLKKLNDAYLRTGDCFFMNKNLSQAADYYDKAITVNAYQTDYAFFQKGIIQGLQQNYEGKLATLTKAYNDFPNSVYREEITYELGVTASRLDRNQDAITYFEKIVNQGGQSKYLSKTYLQLGQLSAENRQFDNAINWYKKAAEEFKGTSDARVAVDNIKSICVQIGDIGRLEQIMKGLDYAEVSQNSLDSLTYKAALNLYESDNCDKAAPAFEKYILNYPSGAFLIEANYFKGDCHFRKGELDAALACYSFIAGKNKTDFTETVLIRAGKIVYDKQKYAEAITYYSKLEKFAESPANHRLAIIALMNAYFRLADYQNSLNYAKSVLTLEKLDKEVEERANYVLATSQFNLGQYDDALANYKKLKSNTGSESHIEALYRIGEIYYKKREFEKAQKHLFTSVNSMGAYPLWLGKSFILLGDTYKELKNYAEARSIYTSVVEKIMVDEVQDQAILKLEELDALQYGNIKRQDAPVENPEIDLD